MAGRRVRAIAACFALACTIAPVVPAVAAQSNDERVAELEGAIGEASADEAVALRELTEVRTRRKELDAAVAALDGQIGEVEDRIATVQGDVDRLTSAALVLDAQVRETSRLLGDAKARASEAAAALYRGEQSAAVFVRVLDAANVQDVYVGTAYLTHVSRDRRAEVESLGDLETAIEGLRTDAQSQRDQAETARQEAAAQRDQLGALRADQKQARDEIAQDEAREQSLVASIRARKDEYTAELAALQASSNAITDLLASRQRGQTKATGFTVKRPVPGAISSAFGLRVHPIYGDSRMHNGIDMSAGHGSPIRAGASGTVAFAGVRGGYGNTVIIDHGNQYATLYAHASKLSVATGEKVDAGETVALVGATGLATAAHLHFEVRLLGVPVNPVNFL